MKYIVKVPISNVVGDILLEVEADSQEKACELAAEDPGAHTMLGLELIELEPDEVEAEEVEAMEADDLDTYRIESDNSFYMLTK